MADLWLLVAAGAAAGFASTLFGIGGGIIMVPILHYVLGIEWHDATALSLLAIAIQSPVGVLAHARRSAVAWDLAIPLALGGVAGVLIGDWLEPRIAVPTLKVAFAALMAIAAYRMVRPDLRPQREAHPLPLVLALGVAAGIVSKLLGIGGGLLTVPVLVLAGTPVHLAVGSSLVPVFTNAALASAVNLAEGAGLWRGAAMGLAAVATAPLGARAAHGLAERGLRRLFAAALVLGALYVAGTSGAF